MLIAWPHVVIAGFGSEFKLPLVHCVSNSMDAKIHLTVKIQKQTVYLSVFTKQKEIHYILMVLKAMTSLIQTFLKNLLLMPHGLFESPIPWHLCLSPVGPYSNGTCLLTYNIFADWNEILQHKQQPLHCMPNLKTVVMIQCKLWRGK